MAARKDRPSSSRRQAASGASGGSVSERASRRAAAARPGGGMPLRGGLLLLAVLIFAGGFFFLKEKKLTAAVESVAGMSLPAVSPTPLDDLPGGDRALLRQAASLKDDLVTRLIGQTTTMTEGGRAGLAYLAGLVASDRSLDALVQLAESDASLDVRRTAAWNLGRIGGPRARLKMGSWSKTGDLEHADLAILAAAATRDRDARSAAEAIIELRNTSDPDVRRRMVGASAPLGLDQLGTGQFVVDLVADSDEETSRIALEELIRRFQEFRGASSGEELRRRLRDRGLDHKHVHVRLNTRRYLRMFGGLEMVRVCNDDLASDDEVLVREAAISLVEMNVPRSCKELEQAMERGLPDATREIAIALGKLCKPPYQEGTPELTTRLIALAGDGGMTGGGAALTLGQFREESAMRVTYEQFVAATDPVVRALYHDGLTELAGQNLGDAPRDWLAWWQRNEKIFELKTRIRGLVSDAKAIGETGERSRYGEAKKMVEQASELLFELEELEQRNYTRWHTDINAMLDGLHKHTILDIMGDEDDDAGDGGEDE